ncbi:alpha/beta hydrolase, partial [Rathayibacter tritici]|uniref:alpha/beta hydrolase n=1 Tax=Rathayibacter tritici TaxID=33888 RepID=UPI000CE7CE3C
MEFPFDDAAAVALADAAEQAAVSLSTQGLLRSAAMEYALRDFRGGYSELFRQVCFCETDNRNRLSGQLHELADTVRVVASCAAQERQRREEYAAWEQRAAEREQRRRADPVAALTAGVDEVFDRPPSDQPIVPPTISGVFSPISVSRTSVGGRAFGGTSSADPEHLDVFVSEIRQADDALRWRLKDLMTAWGVFGNRCSWAPVESFSVLRGFRELLAISAADASWVEQISLAFAAAGGGELSTPVLDVVGTFAQPLGGRRLLDSLSTLSAEDLAALLASSPDLAARLRRVAPALVNEWWRSLDPTDGARFSAQQEALVAGLPGVIGNLEGVPYGARATANESTLTTRIAALEGEAAGLRKEGNDEAAERLTAVESQLAALRSIRASLTRRFGQDPRFLISLTDDEPPLAAVSIGDLDTATNVTYAVPGMGQTTEGMTEWTKASQNLQSLLPPGSAVVAWIGYETPPMPSIGGDGLDVLTSKEAVAGGAALASAVQGLSAVRGDDLPKPNVVGHSYGSTVMAVAASRSDVELGVVVTLGSAGLPDSVDKASDLHAEAVYAGQARGKYIGETESGDEAAWMGRFFSWDHHTNPADEDFGATVFGVETGGDKGRIVTNHDATKGDYGDLAGYFDKGTESLRNTARALSGQADLLTENKPLGMTESVIHKHLPAESVKFEAGDGANEVGKFCKTSAI